MESGLNGEEIQQIYLGFPAERQDLAYNRSSVWGINELGVNA